MSLFWSHGGARDFYSESAIGHLANDWNADVVRAAMAVNMDWSATQRSFLGESPATGAAASPQGGIADPTHKDAVIAAIDAAITHGLYVIVDWHAYWTGGADAANRFPNAPPLEATIEFFLEISNRYPNVPNIIWEILNEPIGPGSAAAVNSWWRDHLRPWKQTVTNAIRNSGDERIIIIGTPRWCQRPDVAAALPVDGTNLAYSMHFYAAGNADHNSIGRQRIITTMMQHRLPVFISEFGLTGPDGGQPPNTGINVDSSNVWMDFLEQYNIGWANWSLNRATQGSASMTGGTAANPSSWVLSASGTFMHNELNRTEPRTRRFYSIDVQRQGSGTVNVRSGSLGPYATGAAHSVELRAVPAQGETFVGWTVNGNTPADAANTDLIISGSWAGGSTDMVVIAEFTGSTSTITTSARQAAAQWSVRRADGSVRVTGPQGSAADIVFYDIRGKVVRRFITAGGTAMIDNAKVPAGNYLMVVRDRATGRDVHKSRVSLVK